MTAEQYFTNHSLTPSFVKERLGWNWNDAVITIPVYNQSGNHLYNKIRHLDYEEKKAADIKTSKFSFDPTGNHPALYCIHKVAKAEQVVLCEGEPDCAQLWQNGIPAVTSTGGVGKFDPVMAQMLAGKEVFICLDTDEAGQDNIMDIARTLLETEVKVKIIDLPAEVKDVCEYFATGKTKEEFLSLISNSKTPGEWWSLHKPEEFTTMTAEELLTTEFPKNPWLIERILPKEGFCFIIAAEASYKTFITLDIALSLAVGKNWLNQETFKVKRPGRVLFIDKENPMEMIQRRIKGLGYSGEALKNIRWVKYPEKLQLIDNEGNPSEFMISLGTEVTENNIDLIVVDSFVDLMIGNENAADDTQAFFNIFRQIFPGRSFVTLHHENKPSQGLFRSDSQRTRGSSNLNAQCMTMFRIELVAKSKTEITIKQTKSRDSQKLDKFLIEARVETSEDGQIYVAGFDYKGVILDSEDDKVTEAQTGIEEMFSASPTLSKQEILDICSGQGISGSTVDRTIKKMIKEGIMDVIPDSSDKRKNNYILINSVKNQND